MPIEPDSVTGTAPASHPMFALPDPPQGGMQHPVRVFDADPDLLAGLEPAAARLVRERVVADALVLEAGRWTPPSAAELGPGAMGLLVVDGLLTRTVRFDVVQNPELVGPGDLLRPWDDEAATASLAFETEWRVLERATVALLDERFARVTCRLPGVACGLLARTVARSRSLSFQLAIRHLRRAEPRVLMLFWHLADRWGRVTPAGTVVPLRLTHAAIARLVGMRRPTVSASLTRLVRSGELARNADGTWTLTGAPPDLTTVSGPRPSPRLERA